MSDRVNWHPSNIFAVRDRYITDNAGTQYLVKLYADGWAVGKIHGMDIWAACHLLNAFNAKGPQS